MGLDKDDIKQLIAILQKGLQEDSSDNEPIKKQNNIKTKKSKVTNNNNNKFVLLGFDKLHKEDIVIDKALKKNPPTPRRKSVNIIDVKCRVCGKSEKINASLLYESPDRYKCNKCSSSPG